MRTVIIAVLAALLSLSVSAQTADLKTQPGYVDFGEMNEIYGEPRVMINLGGSLLKLIAMASKDDPEAAELMQGLVGVRVSVYPTGGNLSPALEQVAKVRSLLESRNWEPIVQVKETDEEVQIFVKANETVMEGIAVMAVNAEEIVFLNILGEIDPAKVGAVMERLNVDVDLDEE